MQTTSHILMIRPVGFTYNEQTAVNNAFQTAGKSDNAQQKALDEFDAFVNILRNNKIDVTVVNDTPEPHTPDSIFPNNWISFHSNGSICLYPMFAVNRRAERKDTVLNEIKQKFTINNTIDLTGYEQQDKFLEGTGSMILDRENNIAYACISQRTDETAFADLCSRFNFEGVSFTATDSNGQKIYHTNVMMCVADKYVVICLNTIADAAEREKVITAITKTNKEIIDITLNQMNSFAGNMLQVHNEDGTRFLVMSTQAYKSLNATQVASIEKYNNIIHSDITTIETNGGGSARCMMAEVFLPLNSAN